ncbi:hypothetical protein BGZ76_007061 [Entomortierella beljakovae]|nr:hypothetical protein BGZ76_007061 [Entomortierella beljakovae]
MSAEGSGSGTGTGVGSSSGPTVFRSFRAVVVQAQLKKMEKEIEKALYRYGSDSQAKSRTVPKISGAARGTRGIMTGGSYAMVTVQEPVSAAKIFIDEISDIINRWKEIKSEIPCRIEVLRALAKTQRVDSPDPTRHTRDVLSIFNDMRRYYPQNDREDILSVIWCLELLSPEFACRKDRIVAIAQSLLRKPELMATIPLSPRNIQTILAVVVRLLQRQSKLPLEKQDLHVNNFLGELIKRMQTGDLGRGNEKSLDTSLQEYKAKIAFLQGLVECLHLEESETVHFLVHQIIPEYWIEPVSKYPFTMDGPIKTLGNAASNLMMTIPIIYSESSELSQSIVLELMTFIGKVLPPASLNRHVSKEAIAMLVKTIFSIFSAEYLEDQQQDRPSKEFTFTRRDDQETTPRASISTDPDQDLASRTPPRTPLSPNVSGENFQARSLPPHVPNLVVDEKSSPVVQKARAYFNDLWNNGYQEVLIYQLKDEFENMSFRRLANVYYRVVLGSDTLMSTPILTATLDLFFSKIVQHQPEPSERLSRLLLQLSVLHKTTFYKPMMACVASDSTQFVTDYLCILSFLEMHMSIVDLYMRDPDMIAVIAMTDVGPERPRGDSQTQGLRWGSCTVGQCVIVLEFIYAIKRLARNGDAHELEAGKMFLVDLERKLGMYLLSKVNYKAM